MFSTPFKPLIVTLTLALGVSACGSDDDDAMGHLQLYNGSSNAPQVYLELDETLYGSAEFSQATYTSDVETGSYPAQLMWYDTYGQSQVVWEDDLNISSDQYTWVALVGDLEDAQVQQYQFALESPEEGFDTRIFNLDTELSLDVYYSAAHESFEDAQMLQSVAPLEMTDTHNLDLGDYKFYLTQSGEQTPIMESQGITFAYNNQYKLVIRDNLGAGAAPYSMDIVSLHYTTELVDTNNTAQVRVFNGYQDIDNINWQVVGSTGESELTALSHGHFSAPIELEYGDYSMKSWNADSGELLSENHLLSLAANEHQSVFYYRQFEEDEDSGEITEYYRVLTSKDMVSDSLYSHQLQIANLSHSYTSIRVHLVRADETIDNATYKVLGLGNAMGLLTLPNDSYQAMVTYVEDGQTLLLGSLDLGDLSEQSTSYLVVEETADGIELLHLHD